MTGGEEECTETKVRQLLRSIGADYEAELAPEGMLVTQYNLLARLAALGPQRPKEFASRMRMRPSTLSRNLRPLQAAGWLAVQPGQDGRSRLISLTRRGQAKILRVKERWVVAQARVVAKAGASRVATLHRLIDEILENLDSTR